MSLVARGSRRYWSERKASRPGGAAEWEAKRERRRARPRRRVRVLDMTGGWGLGSKERRRRIVQRVDRSWSGDRIAIGIGIGKRTEWWKTAGRSKDSVLVRAGAHFQCVPRWTDSSIECFDLIFFTTLVTIAFYSIQSPKLFNLVYCNPPNYLLLAYPLTLYRFFFFPTFPLPNEIIQF